MERRKKAFDEEATRTARELLSELRGRYGVSAQLREPVVYSLGSSRLKELTTFLVKDFLAWPLAALRGCSPSLGIYESSGFLQDDPSITLTYDSSDRATLEHEVRHHFSYECRRQPYLKSGNAITFLKDYYWEDRHLQAARRRFQLLRTKIPEGLNEKEYRKVLYVVRSLSKKEFPRSRYLPDAVAGIITEAHPWVNEGFASEGSIIEAAKLPMKLLLASSTTGIIYSAVPLFLSAGLPFSAGLGYLCGGLLNVSISFLRSLPLDVGVLRWRRMRARISDRDVPKILAYPPTGYKDVNEVLGKIEDYSIF